jgi:glutamate formiminotransferase
MKVPRFLQVSMKRLIECVPNFSEGRDTSRIAALVREVDRVTGARVLDCHSDPDHNRSVLTFAGEPEAVEEAALAVVGKAAELIDLNQHRGEHPRIGATDVLPFVPLEGVSMEECAVVARRAGGEIWRRYGIPVYFYESAAMRPERAKLENIRRGQFESLREEVLRDPDRAPDVGEARLHPTAGAVAVGARKLLIAYNIMLSTADVSVAEQIARAIRESNGGLPAVKAIGVAARSRGLTQVSMNLTDFEVTSIQQAFDAVRREAERRVCTIEGSEIVGLAPERALDVTADYFFQLDSFSRGQILEDQIASAFGEGAASGLPATRAAQPAR